jgi:hypothetical protein
MLFNVKSRKTKIFPFRTGITFEKSVLPERIMRSGYFDMF